MSNTESGAQCTKNETGRIISIGKEILGRFVKLTRFTGAAFSVP